VTESCQEKQTRVSVLYVRYLFKRQNHIYEHITGHYF